MGRTVTGWASCLCLALHLSVASAAQPAGQLGMQLHTLYDKVCPAVVRICHDSNGERFIGVGVVVSSQGHVLTIERAVLLELAAKKQPLVVIPPDGRKVKASLLGWSEEWNIALAKIEGDGSRPHVELSDREAQLGDACAAVEYSRLLGNDYEDRPSLQAGKIISVTSGQCFRTSCRLDDWSPIFSLDGRLIGLTVIKGASGYEDLQLPISVLKDNWQLFADGKNVDEERLRHRSADSADPPWRDLPSIDKDASIPPQIAAAVAATVRIRPDAQPGEKGTVVTRGWSGVIISSDGLIATCAHHKRQPGENVTIYLPDGRDLKGRVLGMSRISDVGLVKITSEATFPHVEMGDSNMAEAETPCWLAGYPAKNKSRSPLVRRSSVTTIQRDWSCILYTDKSVERFGGESGGAVFDPAGRLIAIFEGQNPGDVARHRRIEIIKKQWGSLKAAQLVESKLDEPLVDIEVEFPEAAKWEDTVVEILADGKLCALGTVLARDGLIVTKASQLHGAVSVRLHSGECHPATLHNYSRAYDLALLKIAKADLPAPRWNERDEILPGTLVVAARPARSPSIGVISHELRSIPADHGGGLGDLKDWAGGLQIANDEWCKGFDLRLKTGDVVENVERHLTPDLATYLKLFGDSNTAGELDIYAGDRINITVRRDGKSQIIDGAMPASSWPRPRNESHRYSGFPKVFDVDSALEPNDCGGPIVDSDRNVIGVTIACRREGTGQTHVLPASEVNRLFERESLKQ